MLQSMGSQRVGHDRVTEQQQQQQQQQQQMILKPKVYQNHPESLLNGLLLTPNHRASDSVGLGPGSRICMSKKFSGAANNAGSLASLEHH